MRDEVEGQLGSLARELPGQLFCRGDRLSCIKKERERPLTEAEIGKGWKERPFSAYKPRTSCSACLVYWHVSLAHETAVKYRLRREMEQLKEQKNHERKPRDSR